MQARDKQIEKKTEKLKKDREIEDRQKEKGKEDIIERK